MQRIIILFALLIFSASASTFSAAANADDEAIPTLEQVTIVGQAADLLSGKSVISGKTLQTLPQKNSSISESITLLPRVQIGEEQRTSENAGEILPPLFSISGGRAYENYYAVDGVSLGSLIDPLADNPNALDEVPGHPQRTFIHQDLIESVQVYDSNIPAKFGRFVGGVVDARTRMPAAEFGGKIHLRTTRDSWTKFHIEHDERDDFESSNSFSAQPDFIKYDGGIDIDIPINQEMGVLASYKRIQSELELQHFGEQNQKDKTLETFFLKYAWTPQTPHILELSAAYTPSVENFFLTNVKGSQFKVKRGGYVLNANLRGELPVGAYEVTAAFLENENSRTAPASFFAWRNTPSKNWGEAAGISRSREGGFGDIENSESSFQIQADLVAKSLTTGTLTHTFNAGVEYSRDHGVYDRTETAYNYGSSTLNSAVLCAPGDIACAEGEQYLASRNIYSAQDEDATINYYAGYLEDLITVGRIEFRPGLRISHDDFMKNTNTAHRLAGKWDIFGRGRTYLVGGHNRYYGESLLTYKLREAILPYTRESRTIDPDTNRLTDWTFDRTSTGTRDKYSGLDTPYSDEWNIGIIQKVFGGSLELNYLERKNRDQFARERITETDGSRYYVMNNNGSSDYDSYKAVWEREWKNHYLNLNYTYTDQTASNESYDDTFDEEDPDEKVWYDGSILFTDELPREDFYRKHAFTVIYTGRLPHGFAFTNTTRYLGSYEAIDFVNMSDEEKADAGIPVELNVYEKNERSDYWVFDWRLDWTTMIKSSNELVLTMEVNNVFDRAPAAGDSANTHELGRQFWLGMSYKF